MLRPCGRWPDTRRERNGGPSGSSRQDSVRVVDGAALARASVNGNPVPSSPFWISVDVYTVDMPETHASSTRSPDQRQDASPDRFRQPGPGLGDGSQCGVDGTSKC